MFENFNIGLLEICYLIGSITFIVGLKMMGNPKTARNGNLIGAFGMTIAILGTIFLYNNAEGTVHRSAFKYALIFGAIAIGTVSGWLVAKRVQMTKMPELVSIYVLMVWVVHVQLLIGLTEEFNHNLGNIGALGFIMAGLVIGSIHLSVVQLIIAYLKISWNFEKANQIPAYNIINNVFFVAVVAFAIYIVVSGASSPILLWSLFAAALIYGVLFVFPIGGADMPVVISLLNSFTGLLGCFWWFLI
ncbi:MAG: NAD(P)(+) transhydrogenase (Re/Si-specific) subunit beta [Chitinophagales bacterium]